MGHRTVWRADLLAAMMSAATGSVAGTAVLSIWATACIPTAPAGTTAPPVFEARAGDCETAEQNVEFAPFMVADFEGAAGTATYLYSYTDNTAAVDQRGYQPPVEQGTHCPTDPGHQVFHLTGGPFLGWGGGIGISLHNLQPGLCNVTPVPSFCPAPGAHPEITQSILDVSQWDGISFWARRGANGQPLLRVLVGNKYTDDDVSFLMYTTNPAEPRYCERVKECACINSLDCAFFDASPTLGVPVGGGYYCGSPGIVAGPDITAPGAGQMASNTCNTTRCSDPYPAFPQQTDTAFFGRSCLPFTYRSGVSSSFCYDPVGVPADAIHIGRPADPPPAETDQQCGDHWTYPLHLTTDWQLYLVPFSWMSQQGFAKRFSFFDLTSASVVRFTWDAGNVDFYVDDVTFYKVKRP